MTRLAKSTKSSKKRAAPPANRTVAAKLPKKASAQRPDPAFETYLALLEEIWGDVHPLIGAVTLSALFKSATRRLTPAHPCISKLEVSTEGVDRSALRKALGGVPPSEATSALRDLIRDLLTLFESIAGAVIVRMLLPKIVRAENDAPSKGR